MLREPPRPSLIPTTTVASGDGEARATESQRLHAVFDEYFERVLELNPVLATSIGDPRYNDRFVVSISPTGRHAEEKLERDYLERILAIDKKAADRPGPAVI